MPPTAEQEQQAQRHTNPSTQSHLHFNQLRENNADNDRHRRVILPWHRQEASLHLEDAFTPLTAKSCVSFVTILTAELPNGHRVGANPRVRPDNLPASVFRPVTISHRKRPAISPQSPPPPH